MRVLKDNTLRLDKNEKRIGNFVLRKEESHIKMMDINGVFTHRAHLGTPVGQFLAQSFDQLSEDGVGKGLGSWMAVIFTAFSVVPDVEFLEKVYDESEACMKRHPEAYGLPASEGKEEENRKVEEEMREMMEFENDIKGLEEKKEKE